MFVFLECLASAHTRRAAQFPLGDRDGVRAACASLQAAAGVLGAMCDGGGSAGGANGSDGCSGARVVLVGCV
jgi:hypothetical protein